MNKVSKSDKGFNFREAISQLDQILRGDATQISSLEKGEINLPIKNLVIVMTLLGVLYGICLGSFSLLHPPAPDAAITWSGAWLQLLASMIKFPLLFVLTLFITLPSLYVFNALVGSRLNYISVLKLLVSSIAIMLTILASLGPIVIFFSLCTTSYHFILLLNVAVCAVGGFLALAFLHRTLHRLIIAQLVVFRDNAMPQAAEVEPAEGFASMDQPGAGSANGLAKAINEANQKPLSTLEKIGPTNDRAKNVIRIWTIVFGLVGAQMSWVLRPFVGDPNLPFELFRARESNFFIAVFNALGTLLGG